MRVCAAIALICLSAGAASATSLSPGTSWNSGQYGHSLPLGLSLATPQHTDTWTVGSFGGTIHSWAYWNDGGNHAAGLTFVYQIVMNSNSNILEHATITGDWNYFDISGAGVVDLTGRNPSTINHVQGFPTNHDGTIGMHFDSGNNLQHGETSALMWFQTDATHFQVREANLIDGRTGNSTALVAVIPLPPGSGMADTGLACMAGAGLVQRRRRLRA